VNVDEGAVLAFTALQDWNRVPLGPMLARELKCPVLVDNDTNLAAQGEFHSSGVRRKRVFVYHDWGRSLCRNFPEWSNT